ncbi:MAG: hypothetical protein FJ288_02505 [Planctomycetes bacterium]|nr:hypothetical protein [Planctomycetota bacterium]
MKRIRMGFIGLMLLLPGAAVPGAAAPGVDPAPAAGQPPASGGGAADSPLGIRQDGVRQMTVELEQKFARLAEILKASEPEQAARLLKALQESKEALIERHMSKIVGLLDKGDLDGARKAQDKVIEDLMRLVAVLMADERDEIQKRIEQLEAWKKEIGRLIEKEQAEKRESDKVANKDDVLGRLEARIKQLEALLREQKGLLARTGAAGSRDLQELGRIASAQKDVRDGTERLADAISRDAAGQADAPGASAQPGGRGTPPVPGGGAQAAAQAGAQAAQQGAPAGGQGGQQPARQGGQQEGSGQAAQQGGGQAAGQPGQQGGGQAGQSGGGQGGSQGGGEPGQRPLAQAAQSQRAAEDNLTRGARRAAEGDQREAAARMQQALDELTSERDRLARLPQDHFRRLAERQDQIAGDTEKLARSMQEAKDAEAGQSGGSQGGQQSGGQGAQQGGGQGAGQSGGQSGGQGGGQGGGEGGGQGGQQGGQQQPGQQSVQQARQAMQQASQQHRQQNPQQAAGHQQRSIDELRRALEEIEQALAQLRDEDREELLAALEAWFREVLQRHRPVTAATIDLEAARARRDWTRADRLRLADAAEEERLLADLVRKALEILVEDGTTVIFPKVVSQLADDMQNVHGLLAAERTDAYTQALEKEIEQTLEELIAALERARREQPPQQGQQAQQGRPPRQPLVPNSAELKLLKSAQLRVNQRTRSFDRARPDGPLDAEMKSQLRKVENRQDEVSRMAQEMIERK